MDSNLLISFMISYFLWALIYLFHVILPSFFVDYLYLSIFCSLYSTYFMYDCLFFVGYILLISFIIAYFLWALTHLFHVLLPTFCSLHSTYLIYECQLFVGYIQHVLIYATIQIQYEGIKVPANTAGAWSQPRVMSVPWSQPHYYSYFM